MSSTCKKAYITTPIYYVNDIAHIGHAYTTILADATARYSRLTGLDTFFLTGTDEHGQKIEEAASIRGKETQVYADEISGKFSKLWEDFGITHDKFIRTTDKEHMKSVQHAFQKMYDNGDIYKGSYKGNYCVSCETFFTDTQLGDDIYCPECGKETKVVEEESYFFKLSKYEDKLLAWYNEKDDCILPKSKKQEMISFVKQGLNDLSITRTSFSWGVKLPENMNDPKHVIYVWLDALMNYLSALGYGIDEQNISYWDNTVHIIGKDILKFHAIYWPAFLLSLDMPLPKHIATHGWWTRNGEKMSKSKGNVVNPKEVADAYGLDNFRYFLLREVPFGQDGDFSQKALIGRINGDLSNGLGNLLNRIIGMSQKYFEYKIVSTDTVKYHKDELKEAYNLIDHLEKYIFNMQFGRYLEDIWKILTIANNAITTHEPWTKMKNAQEDEAMATISLCANILAKVSILLSPVMPEVSDTISNALNFKITPENYIKYIKNEALLDEFYIKPTKPLFPKVEEVLLEETFTKPLTASSAKEEDNSGLITIDEFFKSQIVVGTIKSAKKVENSDKLLLLQVEMGEDRPRQIVAGIAKFYTPEDIINTQVCVVANLKPAKIMGIESNGMVLCAKQRKKLIIIKPDKDTRVGCKIG